MSWEGSRLRLRTKETGTSLTKLANTLNVSRVSLNNWINGQTPKGSYIFALCNALSVSPKYFFSEEQIPITVPLHRTRKRAKVMPEMQDAAKGLVSQYINLFRNAPDPGLVPVLRIEDRNVDNARKMAAEFRKMSGITENDPIDYHHVFTLLKKLGIITIFRTFPAVLKDYAFYSKIREHRIVFVNTSTNLLDLIFPLLHEAVHAVRDERGELYDAEEENFCDMVAGFVQFPDGYVSQAARMLNGKQGGIFINTLREFSKDHNHAMYGLAKRLQAAGMEFPMKAVGGADTNLKKELNKTIGDVLFYGDDPVSYIEILSELSPRFMDILKDNLEACTDRKFGEWIDLDNQIDASMAKQALETKIKQTK